METKKQNCVFCKNKKNHEILKSYDDSKELVDFTTTKKYYILKCLACNGISFREEYDCSENYIGEPSYRDFMEVVTYPKGFKLEEITLLSRINLVPLKVSRIYKEVLGAIDSGYLILAGAGFRFVLEAICIELRVSGSSLYDKLNKLSTENRLLTKKQVDRLHRIRSLGNKYIHEVEEPTMEEIILLMRIVNHLLESIYILDKEINEYM